MCRWHGPDLGVKTILPELNEFELNTFFSFSQKERCLIDERCQDLYRLTLTLYIGLPKRSPISDLHLIHDRRAATFCRWTGQWMCCLL